MSDDKHKLKNQKKIDNGRRMAAEAIQISRDNLKKMSQKGDPSEGNGSSKGYGYGLVAVLFIAVSIALALATFGFSLIPQTAVMIGVTAGTDVIGLGLGAKAYSDSRSDAFTPGYKYIVRKNLDEKKEPEAVNSGLRSNGDQVLTPDSDNQSTHSNSGSNNVMV